MSIRLLADLARRATYKPEPPASPIVRRWRCVLYQRIPGGWSKVSEGILEGAAEDRYAAAAMVEYEAQRQFGGEYRCRATPAA